MGIFMSLLCFIAKFPFVYQYYHLITETKEFIIFSTLFSLQLLQKEPSKRLGSGSGGSEEIKCHKWFRSINWSKLEDRKVQPSFLPEVAGKHCIANFEECWTNMPLLDSPVTSPKSSENPFEGYSYVKPAAPFLHGGSSL